MSDGQTRPSGNRSPGRGTGARALLLGWLLVAAGGLAIAGIAWSSLDGLGFAAAWVGYLVVGMLVLRRQPGHRLGWMMLVTGSLSTVEVWGLTATSAPSTPIPAPMESVVQALAVWPWLALCTIVTLFPEGRANSALDRLLVQVVAWGGCLLSVLILLTPAALDSGRANPFGWHVLDQPGPIAQGLGFLLIPLTLLAALGGIVRKWLDSVGPVHGQNACLLIGSGATAAGVSLAFSTDGTTVGSVAWAASALVLPVSMGVAILRYRLYDLDRIISRTTSYVIVTGLVLGVYALVVTAATWLLPSSSNLAVAVATLSAAAVARPLLGRVRIRVDRHFDRARYDRTRTVERFGEQMREDLTTAGVSADLTRTVHATLAPACVGLWVRR